MGMFDGVNDVVTVDSSAGALATSLSAVGEASAGANVRVPTLTLEAWILVAEFQTAYQSILSLGSSVTIQRRNQRSFLSAEVCGVRLSGTLPVYDARWHHVAVVVGSSRGYPEVLLYVDEQIDVAKNITADDVEDFDHAGKLRMGFGEGMRISYFNGYLDDVRLWSVARTQEQIKAGMWGLQGTEPGLEGWWQFDAPNVDGLIKDFGPKQRHGNANGAAARLSRPALLPSTVPCSRADYQSQKQLSSGSWTLVAAGDDDAGAAGGMRPVGRHSHAAVPVSATRIIIHGGVAADDTVLSDLWMFDSGITIGNPWQQVNPVSTVSMYPIYGHHAVLWQKHSLIGYGAASRSKANADDVDMMHINANFGSRIMGMTPLSLPALSYFSLVTRSDNRLLVFGGDVRHHGLDVHEDGRHKGESVSNALYRTRRNSLEQFRLVEIPGQRPQAEFWGHSLAKVGPGLLCLFAGLTDHDAHSRLWTYDVTAGTWLQRPYTVMDVASDGSTAAFGECTGVLTCETGTRTLARYGHTISPYFGTKTNDLQHGAGVVVVFGGVQYDSTEAMGDVTLLYMVREQSDATIFYNLPNTNADSAGPGGLKYHTASMIDDMLLVYGGLRKQQYDSSRDLWVFRFGEVDATVKLPLTGAWSQVSVSCGNCQAGLVPGPVFGHSLPVQRDDGSNRMWLVGGSECVPGEEEDYSVCADEEKFHHRQKLRDMTSMYTIELVRDGNDYVQGPNNTLQANIERVTTMTGETVPVPVPRINAAMIIVRDFLIIFGGASEDAFRESEEGWGDLDDLWGLRVILQGVGSQYRWRVLDSTGGEDRPMARAASGLLYDEPHLYIYAGASMAAGQLSDMWKFNVLVAVPERSSAHGENYVSAVQ